MPQHSQAVAYPSLLQEVERLSENNPGLVRLMSDDTSPSQQQVYGISFSSYPTSFKYTFCFLPPLKHDLMASSTFCLVLDARSDAGRVLMDVLRLGCIPVVADDSAVMPFSEVLDWKRFSIRVYQKDVSSVLDMVMDVNAARVKEMQSQVTITFNQVFFGILPLTPSPILP